MMQRKFLLAALLVSGVVLYLAGCSKQSEDKLAGSTIPCDTLNVSYSQQIVPILQSICYNCHGQGNTAGSGGINLSTYTALKVYADNGYLVGNVTHAPGYVGMPYGLPKLPDCEIFTFVAWVNQGAKNN
ncbi:hypothetical protein [Puia sp.]|jgi:hypothetical protein|uniref:hypothetical protein n=1 Tax=Puia sp. TaxID=2045100 RepID=UPI002F409046